MPSPVGQAVDYNDFLLFSSFSHTHTSLRHTLDVFHASYKPTDECAFVNAPTDLSLVTVTLKTVILWDETVAFIHFDTQQNTW